MQNPTRSATSNSWMHIIYVCISGGFVKWGYLEIIYFNRIFNHQATGHPHFRKRIYSRLHSACGKLRARPAEPTESTAIMWSRWIIIYTLTSEIKRKLWDSCLIHHSSMEVTVRTYFAIFCPDVIMLWRSHSCNSPQCHGCAQWLASLPLGLSWLFRETLATRNPILEG